MKERHENEQYFFDARTVTLLADLGEGSAPVCCICAPTVGVALSNRGVQVALLDIDRRFSATPGFRYFDLMRPEWLGDSYGLIICDPPFYNLSLSKLRSAIDLLSQHDPRQPLIISYLKRREHAFLRVFSGFGLSPTGFIAGYETVDDSPKNEIEFFSNLPAQDLAEVLGPVSV